MATPKMATAGPLDKGQPSDYMRDQAQRNYNRPDFRTVAAAAWRRSATLLLGLEWLRALSATTSRGAD